MGLPVAEVISSKSWAGVGLEPTYAVEPVATYEMNLVKASH